jgi:hypothetical protein
MSKVVAAVRVDAQTLRAECPLCRAVRNFDLHGRRGCRGWWALFTDCDCRVAFYSCRRLRRKYLWLRVPEEEYPA